MRRILIVDDDPQMRFFLQQALKKEDYVVDVAEDGARGVALGVEGKHDVTLMDVKLPDMSGLDAMREIKKARPETLVIVITAFDSRDVALEAVKRGAYDYFTKPLKVEELWVIIRRALDRVALSEELADLKEALRDREKFSLIVGQSPKLTEMLRGLQKLCKVDSTVMVLGESGTGKELVAQAVHNNSSRANKPFVKVNCAAIPAPLLESELFGYRKGAFTDARQDKEGKFQAANGGTLLLDEIGDMTLELQAKILRALETREIERVGSTAPERVDLRIIASTNRDLEQMVQKGEFREDLFYRLAVFKVHVPPLRERVGDVPLLARHFVRTYSEWLNKPVSGLTDGALTALNAYDWPGNVRELKNCIEFAAVMTERDVIDVSDLPPQVTRRGGVVDGAEVGGRIPLDETLNRIEKRIIMDTLSRTGGVQAKAAEILGITERSMWHRVKKLKIDVEAVKTKIPS
ncbi:MAG TPA: sigma-54 dependent transcriptional regulator [Candidatus Brocadiia bacterium]|nr:sigma-54 dependent transcriptional regulator [Candidatus Brocadiia bacterium]